MPRRKFYAVNKNFDYDPSVLTIRRYRVTLDVEVQVHDITKERVARVDGAETDPVAATINGKQWQSAGMQRRMLVALLRNTDLLERFLREQAINELENGLSQDDADQFFGHGLSDAEMDDYLSKSLVAHGDPASHGAPTSPEGAMPDDPELFYTSFPAKIVAASICPEKA